MKKQNTLATFATLAVTFTLSINFTLAPASAQASEVKFYGFVLPNIVAATSGVDSFSQGNLSAYTSASNPLIAASPNHSRMSFQAAQSRFGLLINDSSPIKARLEMDFIDFTKASPTTQALPRLRRALIEYAIDSEDKIVFGQDWDLFSPLAPHTFNWVGHYFESGDLGFMRHQLTYLKTIGASELGVALGFQAANGGSAQDGNIEMSDTPTLALRYTGKNLVSGLKQVGFSVIGTSLLVDRPANLRKGAYGASVFAEVENSPRFDLRFEAYVGRNLFNLGMLSLSYGNAVFDASEAGGYATARTLLVEKHFVFGGFGIAKILNTANMAPGYTTAGSTAGLASTGPGLERNLTVRAGYEYQPSPELSLFLEMAYLDTIHHFKAADVGLADPHQTALVSNVGMQLTF